MLPVRDAMASAVAQLLRDQPVSPGKVGFAWRVAAGPAAARATEVSLDPKGVLHVYAEDPHWRKEIRHAAGVLLQRLGDLLGPGVVKKVTVGRGTPAAATTTPPPPPARR
jgi:hypothetical protein